MKYRFVNTLAQSYPIRLLCRVMKVNKSAFYAWRVRPAQPVTAQELQIYRRAKVLFSVSRQSLGSREMAKKLRTESFEVTRCKAMKVMATLKLQAKQREAYKVTAKRQHSDAVAANLLNQTFNPVEQDQVLAGDIIYLKTAESWVYWAVVMDLYSRRIIGWATDKGMTTRLISRAMIMAYNLRQPLKGLGFHSNRGSQYTSKPYRDQLVSYGVLASMGDVGACRESLPHDAQSATRGTPECFGHNAVVERFFGSLEHDWIFKVYQVTPEHMATDARAYIKYYNLDRLHSSNNDLSPVQYENLAFGFYGFSL